MIEKSKLIKLLKALFKHDGKDIYDYQLKIIESDKQFKIINKSRQVGISYLLAAWGLIRAIFNNEVVLVVSPSERQSKHLMKYAYDLLKILEQDFEIEKEEETKSSLILRGGGAFYSLPSNPRTIRGFTADLIIFDEFAHFLHGVDKEIWEAALPSISRGGEVIICSTPFGKYNLFYQLWHDESFDAERIIINWRDCPHLKIEEIKKQYDEISFAQEYDNVFIEDGENQEFSEKLIKSCICAEMQEKFDDDMILLAGIDIGRHEDLTAIVMVEKYMQNDQCKGYIVRHVKTLRNVPFAEQEKILSFYLQNYNFEAFNIDATGIGEMLAENLASKFSNVNLIKFTHESKEVMVLNLKRLMQNGQIIIPDNPQLINSIRAIKRKYTEGNILKFEAERRHDIGHADLFWALALAVYQDKPSSLPRVVKVRW